MHLDNDINKTKCYAYIMVDGKKKQCSRSKKCGNFCLTHFKQNEKMLPILRLRETRISDMPMFVNVMSTAISMQNTKIHRNPWILQEIIANKKLLFEYTFRNSLRYFH